MKTVSVEVRRSPSISIKVRQSSIPLQFYLDRAELQEFCMCAFGAAPARILLERRLPNFSSPLHQATRPMSFQCFLLSRIVSDLAAVLQNITQQRVHVVNKFQWGCHMRRYSVFPGVWVLGRGWTVPTLHAVYNCASGVREGECT